MKQVIEIKADGEVLSRTMPGGDVFSELHWLQKTVGGHIETVSALNLQESGIVMILDEDGKIKRKPFNSLATSLYKYGDSDPVVGDVILVKADEEKEDLVGFEDEVFFRLMDEILQVRMHARFYA